ncbi:hypothetical protein [Arenimonas donghaensis]|uniref:Uncharacterized protein n=1 Tax=Arenimonas donghaensis DSM 18148 = HO3-R19 TaxID=1121014 RepID=A0A087MFU8_9GAMM|nr:hypothetical protein [Arenimonas donghaensis]KFL35751.1 hypothetical protein N788_06820 [Arenimonas donghaensis DSM 18148 = HO3-R19]
MNRNQSLALALGLIGVAAALAWRWHSASGPEMPLPPAADVPAESGHPVDPPPAGTPVAVARFDDAGPARPLAMPGPIEDLAARAGAGDALAACQLARELGECRSKKFLRDIATESDEYGSTPRCEVLLAQHRDKHFDWLRQAAHAGEPEAMLRYAQGEGFGMSGASFDYLRSPRFDTWRREAPAMLEALVKAGYPEALVTRMMANDPLMGGPLAGALPPDPVTDQAYADLFLLLQGDGRLRALAQARLRNQPDSVVREQARDLAMRWHQDYFKGHTYDFQAFEANGGFALMQAQGKTCSVAPGEATP